MANSEEEFTFPATTESPPSFFESPQFWPRPTSHESEERFKYLCSCQECKYSNNVSQNISFHAATNTESLPYFTESTQPFSPVTCLANSGGFKNKKYEEKFNLYCSCQDCKTNNFNQNSSSNATTTESQSCFTPPLRQQPFTQLGDSAGLKNEEYAEKFNLCSCQECKANNFNQNIIFHPTTTESQPCFTESPPLWRQPFSPVTLLESSRSYNKEEKFNLFKDSNNIKQRKSSCDYNGQEDKMDMLWENLNEEISRTSGKNMPKEIDNPSPGRDVQISCVKALKLSKVNGHTLSRKKASILVFMRVLKRGFAMHRSRRSIKKRAW